MAQKNGEPEGSTRFRDIQLYKKEVLGIGSYGSVYRAQCDSLLCAAKVIHPTLIIDNPGAKSPQGRFRAECEFLGTLRHPNIVQYLGTWTDPTTSLPVLLMELMNHSLTQFLERAETSLHFHTQVNICHDIVLALSFLHSNNIIHRDLSSNNILMIADKQAKVTDFGMAQLKSLRDATRLNFTMCPGTDVYMPPEAVKEGAKYSEKIDCFSFGVLAIQILSQKYPSPGNRVKSVLVGGRELLEPQTEYSRREEDIKIVDTTHPLLSIACDCLKDKEGDRPSATELCRLLAGLKEDERYARRDAGSSEEKESGAEEELRSLKEELEESKVAIRDKDRQISLCMEKNRNTIETMGMEIQDLQERLNKAQIENMELLRPLPAKKNGKTDVESGGTEKVLEWRQGTDAPCVMTRSSDAVMCGSFVYMRPNTERQLYVYNIEGDTWTKLLPSPTTHCTLANVKNTLVVIGGFNQNGMKTNKLYNLSTADMNYKWFETYPPMPTTRDSATAASDRNYLVVAGGIGKSYLETVEVLCVDSKQWFEAAGLPSALFSASAAICNGHLYILGGSVTLDTITHSVFTCSVRSLVKGHGDWGTGGEDAEGGAVRDAWVRGPAVPSTKSTCVSFHDRVLAVGGKDESGSPSNKIWTYERGSEKWVVLGECLQARSQCYAFVLPSNELMVVGGYTKKFYAGETNTTELAVLVSSTATKLRKQVCIHF